MRYLSMIAIPVLGAIGLQGLRDRPMSESHARRLLAAGVVLLLGIPLLAGGTPFRFILLAVAMLAAVPTLHWLATARKRWAMMAVVTVVSIELLASAVYSGMYQGGTIYTGLESGERPNLVPQVLEYPELSESDFLRPTAIVDMIRAQPDRYLTYAPPAASFDKGYLFTQRPQDWPALAMERGTLFGIPDVLGYNPVQLPRYWTYIRATNSNPVFYNASVLGLPSLQNVRLMGVRYVVVPRGVEAVPEGVDWAIEAVGSAQTLQQCIACLRPGGTAIAVGLGRVGATFEVPINEIVQRQKRVVGSLYGSANPLVDLPRLFRLYLAGRLPLDELLGADYALEQVNEAYAALTQGAVGRAVLVP